MRRTRWWAACGAYGAILTAHCLVRPMRDAYGIVRGSGRIPAEVLATFVVVAAGSLAWSGLASRLKRGTASSTGLHLLAASLAAFSIVFQTAGTTPACAAAFFVWGSAFNLIATSLFWSRIVDVYTEEAGRTWFPRIAVGGTVGALIGPSLAVVLSRRVAAHHLLLGAAALMTSSGWLLAIASRREPRMPALLGPESSHGLCEPHDRDQQRLGGSWISGLKLALGCAQLRNLTLYVVAGSMLGSLVYVEQARVVSHCFAKLDDRIHFFATLDLTTNFATIAAQLALAAIVTRRLGTVATVAALPLAGAVAATSLALSPSLAVLFAAQVTRRVVDYGLAGPAREVLFTRLGHEHKYKAKTFVDVVAPRLGDTVGAFAEAVSGGPSLRSAIVAWVFATGAWVALGGVQRNRAKSTNRGTVRRPLAAQ